MKIKYKDKSGKRQIMSCNKCNEEFETLSVKGSVNTKKAGTYKVSCTITDPYTAVSVTKNFKFKVGKKPVNTTTEVKVPEKDSTQIKTQKQLTIIHPFVKIKIRLRLR